MRRNDLVQGEHYAVCHPQYRYGSEPLFGSHAARRVEVLHTEPYKRPRRLSHNGPTPDPQGGSGVHVAYLNDDGKTTPRDDEVVALSQLWMTWDEWVAERVERRAAHDEAEAQRLAERQEAERRRNRIEVGFAERDVKVRRVGEGYLGVSLDDAERILELLGTKG